MSHSPSSPSNKSFGQFFSGVFLVLAMYLLFHRYSSWAMVSASASLIFLAAALVKPVVLTPLNQAWMGLGLLLGKFISPIVLGIMFFGLITPIAVALRLTGRDELRLKRSLAGTHWRVRTPRSDGDTTSFKDQY